MDQPVAETLCEAWRQRISTPADRSLRDPIKGCRDFGLGLPRPKSDRCVFLAGLMSSSFTMMTVSAKAKTPMPNDTDPRISWIADLATMNVSTPAAICTNAIIPMKNAILASQRLETYRRLRLWGTRQKVENCR
jgi:hypothetical protein